MGNDAAISRPIIYLNIVEEEGVVVHCNVHTNKVVFLIITSIIMEEEFSAQMILEHRLEMELLEAYRKLRSTTVSRDDRRNCGLVGSCTHQAKVVKDTIIARGRILVFFSGITT